MNTQTLTPVEPAMPDPEATAKRYDSRTADKYVVRLEAGMRDAVRERAVAEHRSMNGVMLCAIRMYLGMPVTDTAPMLTVSSQTMEEMMESILGRLDDLTMAVESK